MSYKSALLFVTFLVGSLALPAQKDMSIFFDHTDNSRIVGGTIAGSVPHMVAITNGLVARIFVCGGSILTTRHVLTAAHCIDAIFTWGGSLSTSARLTMGTNYWNTGGQHYNIARNVTHPNWSEWTLKNDIGILVTWLNIALSDTAQLVNLSYNWVGAGVATRVNGWGRIVAGGAFSPILLELEATVVDGFVCISEVARLGAEFNIIGVPPVEPHIELCTFRAVNQGACNGDSGSALLRADTGQQIGVVSWGLPCARGAPDMFARVSAYQSWIAQSIA